MIPGWKPYVRLSKGNRSFRDSIFLFSRALHAAPTSAKTSVVTISTATTLQSDFSRHTAAAHKIAMKTCVTTKRLRYCSHIETPFPPAYAIPDAG